MVGQKKSQIIKVTNKGYKRKNPLGELRKESG